MPGKVACVIRHSQGWAWGKREPGTASCPWRQAWPGREGAVGMGGDSGENPSPSDLGDGLGRMRATPGRGQAHPSGSHTATFSSRRAARRVSLRQRGVRRLSGAPGECLRCQKRKRVPGWVDGAQSPARGHPRSGRPWRAGPRGGDRGPQVPPWPLLLS